MGALVGCRLAKVIRSSLTNWPLKFYFWTDSSIVLQWIKGSALRWKQFVRNRVTEVQSTTDPASWRHCPGKENPADLLTRGEKMQRLSSCKRWFKGPEWLIRTTESWPNSAPKEKVEDEELEAERVKTQVLLAGNDRPTTSVLSLENCSRLQFVLRVTAWVYRFINNCQPKVKVSGPLTAEEIQRADLYWIREAQKQEYNTEMQQLRRGDGVHEKSPIAELRPVLDGDHIMRISSRLQHASLSTSAKHPILLPNGHRLAELVVEKAHRRLLHGGVQDTMTEVRERYWIPRCRQLVKKVLHRCVVCRRFKTRPASAPVAPLPADRVKETGPFDVIWIDFAGPLFVKSPDGGDQKTYIALFTCAVTRAVHLELVTTMSTASFLLAFRRFTARRGVPSVIYTDNASTFKKADREIWKALRGPSFQDHLTEWEIHWKYIVERAPWWGGFWERLVRVVKNNLKRILGKNRFSFEELTTILHGVEAVVNSRPLTSVADSPDEAEPLTPAHFLVGKRVTSLPSFSGSAPKPTEDLQARWKQQQLLLDRFWKRWKEEYLLQLRSAHMAKTSSRKPTLRVGDLVIVHNERLPRHLWKTGRITEVFPGRDKNIRACAVRLSDKTVLRRPVQLLYPLEIC
ncbi:uncharacterized protein LOC135395636 [Ornithodoros turicata]|uniref:uncharacterized protein LOC135395636 n=1 Tax=Ornithodoros turicata TaxID=34597 RepID=UPI003139086B